MVSLSDTSKLFLLIIQSVHTHTVFHLFVLRTNCPDLVCHQAKLNFPHLLCGFLGLWGSSMGLRRSVLCRCRELTELASHTTQRGIETPLSIGSLLLAPPTTLPSKLLEHTFRHSPGMHCLPSLTSFSFCPYPPCFGNHGNR